LRKVLFLPTRETVCDHFLSLLAVPEDEAEPVAEPVA
jgi:hypothetical protein